MNLRARWGRAECLPSDAVRLIVAWGVASLSSGYLPMVRTVYLIQLGFTFVQIGLLSTVASISATLQPALYGALADRYGRKPILVLVYLSTIPSFLIYLLSTDYTLLLMAALIGGTGAMGYRGVVVQQAFLTEQVGAARRNTVFSLQFFGVSAGAALGALLRDAPEFFQARFGLDTVNSVKPLFILGLLLVGVALVVIHPVREGQRPTVSSPPREGRSSRSWRLFAKFSAYAMLAEFGAYLVLPLVPLWIRFDQLDPRILGYVSTASTAVGICTYLVGPPLSQRLGVVRTVVLARMGGVLCLALLPVAPTPLVALLLFRGGGDAIQHISVPLLPSYLMAVLRPEERASTAGVIQGASTTTAYLGGHVASTLSGYSQEVLTTLPLILSVAILTVSNVLFYVFFGRIQPPEEQRQPNE